MLFEDLGVNDALTKVLHSSGIEKPFPIQKATLPDAIAGEDILGRGQTGSGKTLVACQIALDMVFKREIEKIVITRPTVAKEDIGFLPGDLKEKMDPWLAPIYANLHLLYDKDKIDKMVSEGQIEIVPFAFMRSRTFPDAVVIVDECQNITHGQTEMILGRLGKGVKIVFSGDKT